VGAQYGDALDVVCMSGGTNILVMMSMIAKADGLELLSPTFPQFLRVLHLLLQVYHDDVTVPISSRLLLHSNYRYRDHLGSALVSDRLERVKRCSKCNSIRGEV
jgi:hypothetical protein